MGTLTATEPAVAQLIQDAHRLMIPARRLSLVAEMCAAVHELHLAGLRARHPGADEGDLKRRVAEICLGPKLAAPARSAAQR